MKKIITLVIVIIVSTAVQLVDGLPWWSFVVPVFLLGVFLPLQKWKVPSFVWGFIAGFLVWTLTTIFYEQKFDGEVMSKAAHIANVNAFLLYLLVGAIGGILSGLALYSGFLMRRGREELKLELP